jgi:hypothetical protein
LLSALFPVADSHVFIGPPLEIADACPRRLSGYLIGFRSNHRRTRRSRGEQREGSLSHDVSLALEVIGVKLKETEIQACKDLGIGGLKWPDSFSKKLGEALNILRLLGIQ